MSSLRREDFSLGPISFNEIEPKLFLGGLAAAKDVATLRKLNVTHILTIDTCPLPRSILDLEIVNKFIQLSDLPNEDLLSHFDDTDEFIRNGLSQGVVLVHCYFGVSRSATVIIAFIMKKYNQPFNPAFDQVKAKRSIVFPNEGFRKQLNLYHEMNHRIDPSHMRFKIFRLGIAANRVKKAKILPQEYHHLIQPDPGITQSRPDPNVYRCKRCRRVLALESNLIVHKDAGENCRKTLFLEPIAWMNVAQTTQGKLVCPKCEHKVGSFSWIMGCQCPCEVQVAPAFYLVPSKVDFCNVVKNVEVTF